MKNRTFTDISQDKTSDLLVELTIVIDTGRSLEDRDNKKRVHIEYSRLIVFRARGKVLPPGVIKVLTKRLQVIFGQGKMESRLISPGRTMFGRGYVATWSWFQRRGRPCRDAIIVLSWTVETVILICYAGRRCAVENQLQTLEIVTITEVLAISHARCCNYSSTQVNKAAMNVSLKSFGCSIMKFSYG